MEYYQHIKALHLIFVITWFAGLFYIPRLFVYQIESHYKPSPEKEILGELLKLMAKRLWFIITWPSAIFATIFAVWLIVLMPNLLKEDWMLIKLVFVALLILYQLKTHQIFNQLQKDNVRYSSNFMRIWNEGSTIILFSVVFLVVLKNGIDWIFGMVGLFSLIILLVLGIKLYKRIRAKNPNA